MKVVFRADSSLEIGSGHIHRCLVLAAELSRLGWSVEFICRDFSGSMCALIEKNYKVHKLLPQNRVGRELRHSGWLGATQGEDASESLPYLEGAQLLVVDHYGIDSHWESTVLAKINTKIFVIDDLADRSHHCDFFLDTNYRRKPERDYADLLPKTVKAYFGPRHALLRPEFFDVAKTNFEKDTDIALFFGSMDPHSASVRALEALDPKINLKVRVITTEFAPTLDELQKLAKEKNVSLQISPHSLAESLARSRFAIGAGGVSLWERSFLEVPSLIISMADNQIPASQAMHEVGAAFYFGNFNDPSPNFWAAAWEKAATLLNHASTMEFMEDKLRKICKPHLNVAQDVHHSLKGTKNVQA